MEFTPDQVRNALLSLIAFIVSVSVHEFGHAWAANRLGDDLPRSQGRLTLSPLAHIDLIGTIIVPLVAAFTAGVPLIAWGRPVQTNPAHYSTARFSRRTGDMLVSLAGPAMNLVLAVVVSIVFLGLAKAIGVSRGLVEGMLSQLLVLNVALFFFNLIPVPPLDGGAVLAGLLPESLQVVPQTLRRYGIILFFILLISGALRFVMRPAYHLATVWAESLLRAV